MIKDLTDMELANDLDAQLKLITSAYTSGSHPDDIDLALDQVTRVRRMKRKGFFELVAESAEASVDTE